MCGNRAVINIKVNPDCDTRFIFYTLLLNRQKIETLAEGSVQKNLYVSSLGKLQFQLPPLSEQKRISETVGALDDRIALLRETNATLEAIAQALFKSWFVDFDPVHAKASLPSPCGRGVGGEGAVRSPTSPHPSPLPQGEGVTGMDEATAALFPDSFEESELGLVPRGWRVGTLSDLLVLQRGFDLPSSDRVPGDYPIIAASGPSGTHNIPMAKAPGVVTGRSGVLGRVFLELEDHWPLNTTLWVKEFRLATPCYSYELLRLADLASFNAGSAVPTLNRNHIHSLKYLLPSNECIQTYEEIALSLHTRARANQNQAQTLAALRDTLLPRLISGQLRLPEAEATLEVA
jgi:type I restriction enzyme S subunit